MITAGSIIAGIGAIVFIAAMILHGTNMISMIKHNTEPSSKVILGPILGGIGSLIFCVGIIVLIIGVALLFL